MTYRTLLTHAQPYGASDQRVEAAAALAMDLDAVLIGLAAESLPVYAISDPYGMAAPQLTSILVEQQTKNLEDAHKRFLEHAGSARQGWRSTRDLPTPALARASRSADLILVGGSPAGAQDKNYAVDIGELILTAGRPVLVAPPSGGRLAAKKVLIAWKDSRESRRAVSDALPFLLGADEVMILGVGAAEDAETLHFETTDVAEQLKRHGVKSCRPTVAPGAGAGVEVEILSHIEDFGADLVVAGGYGHSRAAEWVLGGVTRTLLHLPDRFVLLSH